MLKAPTPMLAGFTAVTVGDGFTSVTVAEEDFVGSATLVAATVTALGFGTLAGPE